MNTPTGLAAPLPDPAFVRGKGISWRRTSIISKLTLLLLAVGVPLSGVVAWSLNEVVQADRLLVRAHAVGHAVVLATRVETLVRETRAMLASVAARPAVRAMDPLHCDPFLDELRTTLPRYTSISTVDLDWRFVCSTSPLLGRTVATYTQVYERVKAADDMVISGPVVSRLTGNSIVIAAYPIKDAAGRLAGLAVAPIATASLGEVLAVGEMHADSVNELRDTAGGFIASYPEGRRVASVPDGIERFRAGAPVKGTQWIAASALAMEPALASSRRQRGQAIAVSLLVFVLAGWLALVFARRITRPLRELERDARLMAAGAFDHRSRVAGPDEVGQVAAAFNDMGRAVQEHEAMHRRAVGESQQRQQRLGGMVASALDAIVTVDDDGRIAETNPAARTMFDYASGELEGEAVELILLDRFHAGQRVLGSPRSASREIAPRVVRGLRKDGSELVLEASISHHETGGSNYTTAFLRDITARLKADEQIRRLNRIHAVLTGINALIVRTQGRAELFKEACRIAVDDGAFRLAWVGVIDPQTLEGMVVEACGAGEEYARNITLTARAGRPDSARPASRALRERRPVISNDIAADPALAAVREEFLDRGLRSLGCFPFSLRGRVVGVIVLFAGQTDAFDGEETRLLGNLADDISFALDQIDKQARLDFLAYHDPVSGLANRALFLERAGPALRAAAAARHPLAILVLDVERFRNVNDSLGRLAGDALLRQLAEWLARAAGDATTVARLDGDRFALLLPEIADPSVAAEHVGRWLEELRAHPFPLEGAVFRIEAKMGIALFPADGATAEILLRNAEAALKRAKAEGERYLFHSQQMTESAIGKLTLENQLRQAVEDSALAMHYLPRVSLASGRLTGAEAVLRWDAPAGSDSSDFIPVLEQAGLMPEVGRWMLRQAVADGRRWKAAGLPGVRVAIDMSARQLRHQGFLADVAAAVADDPDAAGGLEIEVSEGAIMEDVKRSIERLAALRAMRVTVAIDDFGAGISSLRYLGRLPADVLKIDESFVADMTTGPQGLALVSTFIRLAHSLKLKVVAQGVVTAEQAGLLRLLGCDEAQGPLVGEALSGDSFQSRLAAAGAKAQP